MMLVMMNVAAFVQVCECQIFFARRNEGDSNEMPHFAGQRGPEIMRGLLEIESVFEKNLNFLHSVRKTILDVKATTWHDDYNRSVDYQTDLLNFHLDLPKG